eukprot:TRINITY_DN50986_c0_g1_i1.p1 TRINITY_DN50986_c0_g1~~TRINITY_DN50986_c0_g1_i1.p1  ORF type:complete len:580 (+),score=85.28 TRINITY_DN50986_c0_g1_i1:41-1741(+)
MALGTSSLIRIMAIERFALALVFCIACIDGKTGFSNAKLDFLPLPSFGVEVRGVSIVDLMRRLDAKEEQREVAMEELRELKQRLFAERLLVFRMQGDIPWQDQIAFSSHFGEVFNESAHVNREKHPAVPDDRIAYFSNDERYGTRGAGTEGWHVDGNVVDVPHAITFIHAASAIPGGDTYFVPLREVVKNLRKQGFLLGNCEERAPPCIASAKTGAKNLSVAPLDDVIFQSSHLRSIKHPLIYPHPVSGQDTMIFGLGKLSGAYRTGCYLPSHFAASKEMSMDETDKVTTTILKGIRDTDRTLHWRWASGDLLMVDNRAVAHLATGGTQASSEEVGLRLLRRTTVKGHQTPKKRPSMHALPHECIVESDGQKRRSGDDSEGPNHYCIFSLAGEINYEEGKFESRDAARERCRVLSPKADLAVPSTAARNFAAGNVVSSTSLPHWIAGDDAPNGHVTWLDGSNSSKGWQMWHEPSGQPNDCDGPETETCMFMGPNARWFDFACAPKAAGTSLNKTITPGPEITWEDGVRRMYNIFPLCGLLLERGEAQRLGLRARSAPGVVIGRFIE